MKAKMKPKIVALPAPSTTCQTAPTAQTSDQFVSADELLKRIPVSAGTLANWRKAGLIPFVKINHRIIFHLPSVSTALLRMQRGGDL